MTRQTTGGWGLALGGGTARGMAHVGALKVLEERGAAPAAFSGTSYGAVIAAMAALGMPALEIERVIRSQSVIELWALALDFGLHKAAIVHGERLESYLDRTIFYGARIEDAERPLAIAATDLRTGRPIVLRSGSVARAVRASSALPGVFASVAYDGAHLVDGGFVEPVPFAALDHLGVSKKLGIHTGLDLRGSEALQRLRKLEASAYGRWLHRQAARMRGDGPWGRLVIGLSLSLRSYRNDATPPPDAEMITVAPPIAWWDFHRSPIAIETGEHAMAAWWDERGARLVAGEDGTDATFDAPGEAHAGDAGVAVPRASADDANA